MSLSSATGSDNWDKNGHDHQTNYSSHGDALPATKEISLAFRSPFYDFGKNSTESELHRLINELNSMSDLIEAIKAINDSVRVVCNNSAIEASRSPELLAEFHSLTVEIGNMIERSEKSTQALEILVKNLLFAVLESIGVQLSEQANDIIDKIDRNLFERNCDCQAWATFPANIRCLETKSQSDIDASCKLLGHICHIYEVYRDILVFDASGDLVSAANHKELTGINCQREEWFRRGVAGEVYVTDMFYCPIVKGYSVAYTAPVKNEEGVIIGVLSTRFNWDFVNEMLDNTNLADDNDIWVISNKGVILCSRDRAGVLQDQLSWLECGKIAIEGLDGFSLERTRNGHPGVLGVSRTQGYNNYQGKEWSVIINQPLDLTQYIYFCKTFTPVKSIESHTELSLELKPSVVLDDDILGEAEEGSSKYINSDIANAKLAESSKELRDSIEDINHVNFETLLMSLNATVKSARAGVEGRGLAVISDQIRILSVRSKETTEKINDALGGLTSGVDRIIHEKVKDAAWDAIDKVDRNLFERNCDVQAWTIFDEVRACAKSGKPNEKAHNLLAYLHRVYEIYDDIYLFDRSGKLVESAVNSSIRGEYFSEQEWFRTAISGQVSVTDMFYCDTTKNYTVAYSAPVSIDGYIVGVLSTRFNWNFIYDIIDQTTVPHGSSIYLLNTKGKVIASSDRKGILEDSFSHTEAYERAMSGERGVALDTDEKTGQKYYVGYAQTKGYNRYQGKGWITLVYQPRDDDL